MNSYPKCEIKLSKYTSLKISSNIGENISSSMERAENYIYIISPYLSPGMIQKLKFLKKQKPHLDIKLLFSDTENFLEDKSYQEVFSELLAYRWKENTTQKLKSEEETRILRGKILNYRLTFYIILFLFLGFYFLNQKLSILSIPVYFLLPLAFLMYLFIHNQIMFCKKKLKKLQEATLFYPEFIPLLNYKFIRCWHQWEEEKIFPHVKLFLMDFKSSYGHTIDKAFWGSANFTHYGFSHNIESLTETIDYEVTNSLKVFFHELYSSNLPEHDILEIANTLFKKRLLKSYQYNYNSSFQEIK